MQMSLKTPTIDGGIIQEKVDLILGHLCAHGWVLHWICKYYLHSLCKLIM